MWDWTGSRNHPNGPSLSVLFYFFFLFSSFLQNLLSLFFFMSSCLVSLTSSMVVVFCRPCWYRSELSWFSSCCFHLHIVACTIELVDQRGGMLIPELNILLIASISIFDRSVLCYFYL